MKHFDYMFLANGLLPAGLVNLVEAIAALREREQVRKSTYPDVFTRLESVAIVQSVKGSNAIALATRSCCKKRCARPKP